MKKRCLATLMISVIGLVGADCDPDNQPPNAPKFRIEEYDSVSFTGVFKNDCKDPDKRPDPPRKCEQWVVVVGGGQPARQKQATNGVVRVGNRIPGESYDIYPYHTDSSKTSYGTPILGFKMAGTTGPRILGISPSEVVVPSNVTINGLGLKSGLAIDLVSAETGAAQRLPILSIAPNRIVVSVPKPTGLDQRRPYFIVVGKNNKVHARADVVYLNPDQSTRPEAQSIQLSFIRWKPSGYCDGNLCRDCREIDGWEPLIRTQISYLLWGNGPFPTSDPDDFWPDLWTDAAWSKWEEHFKDTGSEWAAMCSESWSAGGRYIRGAAEVGGGRVTLPSGLLYWAALDLNSHDVAHLANRRRFNSAGDHRDFCTEDQASQGLIPRTVPGDCVRWQINQPGRVNVHLVGAFYKDGAQVNPNDMRAIADPPSAHTTNTRGMILISDNPFLNARVKQRVAPSAASNNGCFANDVANGEESIWHWYLSGSDPIGGTYWWGPPEGRSAEPTPNLLSHELHHVLTDYVHDPNGEPDPCYTPAVGPPTDACPRGFNMGIDDSITVYSQCGRALDKSYTN